MRFTLFYGHEKIEKWLCLSHVIEIVEIEGPKSELEIYSSGRLTTSSQCNKHLEVRMVIVVNQDSQPKYLGAPKKKDIGVNNGYDKSVDVNYGDCANIADGDCSTDSQSKCVGGAEEKWPMPDVRTEPWNIR